MRDFLESVLVGITVGLLIALIIIDRLDLVMYPVYAAVGFFLMHTIANEKDSSKLGGYESNGVYIESPAVDKDSSTYVTGGKSKHFLQEKFAKEFLKRDASRHSKNPVFECDAITKEILASGKMPELTHLLPNAEKSDKFSRILDLTKTKKYERRTNTYKPALHWGQLKLFLSEVEFLTLAVQEVTANEPDKEIWFVYAGSAPGNHIIYLAELFPMIHFELYDPNDFVVKDTNMIKTHVQFFTNEDAKYWASSNNLDKKIVFCTDIRTEPATQENIVRNMNMQLEWWKIMNPELSMFKFRLPWEPGKTEYPEGDIYIQAYPGPTSSETRLICKKDAKLKLYDNTQYEDACFYHNLITRSYEYTDSQNLVLDKCYDCMSFEYIMKEYLTIAKVAGSKKAGLSLKQIIKEVENEITQGHNTVKSNTVRQITEELDKMYRMQWNPCDNSACEVCPRGLKGHSRLSSRATIENEERQLATKTEK